ncbi:MAG: type I restriction endonuclease subunit R [Planctomycetota bacterium]
MSPHTYTEDQLVEQPAIGIFASLGWQTTSAMEETFGPAGTLGRETKSEVVLTERLRVALTKLNPDLPPEAIQTAIDELSRDRSAMSLEAANREIYKLLKEGIPVSIPDRESLTPGSSPRGQGGQSTERLRVVDWENPEQNDFLLVSQLSVVGNLYTCRPDLVGFVNGLPWVVIELKKPLVPARAAFDENLTHYKQQIPQLFWYNAMLIASNGTDSRVGSLTADWERFFEWKRIESEDEPRRVSLEVMLRGTCDRSRLLDLVENFTLFSEHKAGLVKILGQNHQFLGVNNAIASMLEARKSGHGRGGVFWQTQGSGKSFSMVFFAQKVLRKLAGNWTFVVVTDRVELDDQIAKTFKNVGAVSESEGEKCHASSGAKLRELLRGNHRYVFTLVHKFQTAEMLTDRSDVIVLTDEAHRSQYDTLALNMRASLPKAMFLAFTGTPLIAGEERTKEVFGDYVSIYDFQQSVEDGATVPLYYENRTPELQLVNPDLNENIYELIENAELDAEQEEKLAKVLGKQYHLITRDDRLETVAQDIVQHFLGRGFVGKAMVVSIDKATALRMHDKVKKYWAVETARVRKELDCYDLAKSEEASLRQRLEILTTTDMAVIVSPAQNEIEQMKKLGIDIEPHRKRMNESQPGLDEKFKDPDDPLRLVFVCAMWLTGFDAPSCSTVYLDKPMRNHTLMQTIARANRVYPGKHSGVIVDYANVFASLEKALAIYGAGKGGTNPVKDKGLLVTALREAIAEATGFCATHGVDLVAMEALPLGGMERLSAIENAIDALISPDDRRREFFGHDKYVGTLYRAVKPDPAAVEFSERVAGIATLAGAIRAKLCPNPPDIATILQQIGGVLDESITGLTIREEGPPAINLAKINFEALAAQFKESKHKNTDLEVLKAAIAARLGKMLRLNRTRTDFTEKFEELIESYNSGSRNIEQLFEELMKLSRSLDAEQERHVRENLSIEEQVIFDILTRPSPELSTAEREQVKKVARELLARLKQLLVLNWRQKSAARSTLKLAIEDTLDDGLPDAYSPEIYNQKCSALFEHVYESYPEQNAGVYAEVG